MRLFASRASDAPNGYSQHLQDIRPAEQQSDDSADDGVDYTSRARWHSPKQTVSWAALPTDIKLHVISELDCNAAFAFGQVDGASRYLVDAQLRPHVAQWHLLADAWGKRGVDLMQVMDRHRPLFSAMRSPLLVFEPDATLLAHIDSIAQDCARMPVALFANTRPRTTWPCVPSSIEAFDERHYFAHSLGDYEFLFACPPMHRVFAKEDSVRLAYLPFLQQLRQCCGYLNLDACESYFPTAHIAAHVLRQGPSFLHKDVVKNGEALFGLSNSVAPYVVGDPPLFDGSNPLFCDQALLDMERRFNGVRQTQGLAAGYTYAARHMLAQGRERLTEGSWGWHIYVSNGYACLDMLLA